MGNHPNQNQKWNSISHCCHVIIKLLRFVSNLGLRRLQQEGPPPLRGLRPDLPTPGLGGSRPGLQAQRALR